MKTNSSSLRFLLAALLLGLLFSAIPAHAAPITRGGFIISKPGKYKVVRPLTGKILEGGIIPFGINITASDVKLDLNGFTIAPRAGRKTSESASTSPMAWKECAFTMDACVTFRSASRWAQRRGRRASA